MNPIQDEHATRHDLIMAIQTVIIRNKKVFYPVAISPTLAKRLAQEIIEMTAIYKHVREECLANHTLD